MSVLIVPCFVRTKWDIGCLQRLLISVQKQTKPFDKVYVVDDASPYSYTLPFDFVEHIRLSVNGGPARARNIGIDKALALNAQYLLFTDHDCILDKQWNEQMTLVLTQAKYGAVGGITYSWGKTLLDYYHDINGTLSGKWLLPEKKELWYMPSLNSSVLMKSSQPQLAKMLIYAYDFGVNIK